MNTPDDFSAERTEPSVPGTDTEPAVHSTEDEEQPADESYLLGRAGVDEQTIAELARAEAELHAPPGEEVLSDDSGAVV